MKQDNERNLGRFIYISYTRAEISQEMEVNCFRSALQSRPTRLCHLVFSKNKKAAVGGQVWAHHGADKLNGFLRGGFCLRREERGWTVWSEAEHRMNS